MRKRAISGLVAGGLMLGLLSGVSSAQTQVPLEADALVGEDEEWIVYQWVAPGGDGIYLIRTDGTGQHQIAGDVGGSQILPTWSPDGQQIGFRKDTAEGSEIWVVDADGTGAEMLYGCERPCNTATFAEWSPDGKAIYFGFDANASSGPPATFGVGRLDLATGSATEVLVREDGMTAEEPRISPDGSQVVYTRFNDPEVATGSAIFVSDLAGGDERQLTDWELWAAYPDWGPDDTIVFTTHDLFAFQDSTEPANLYTIAPDGTDLRQLTSFGDHDTRATQPRWTPDGSGITFTQVDGTGWGTRRIAYVGADGEGMRFLTPEPTEGNHPELRPVPGG